MGVAFCVIAFSVLLECWWDGMRSYTAVAINKNTYQERPLAAEHKSGGTRRIG